MQGDLEYHGRFRERSLSHYLGLCAAAGYGQILKREFLTALLCRRNDVEIPFGRDPASNTPRVNGGVGQAQISGEIAHGRPYVFYVIHDETIRTVRISVNTHIAHCHPQGANLQ